MTPLQLRDTRISSVRLDLIDEAGFGEEGELSLGFRVQIQGFDEEGSHTEEEEPLHVSLRIENAENNSFPLAFSIEMQGLFTLHDQVIDWDREEQLKLLRRNGSSMLYSQLREFFLYISTRATGVPVHLPSVPPAIFDGAGSLDEKPEDKLGTE